MGFEIRIPFSFKRRPASDPEPISRICNFIRILCGTETNTETLKIFCTRGYCEANVLKSGFKVHGKTPTFNFCWTIIKVKIRLEVEAGQRSNEMEFDKKILFLSNAAHPQHQKHCALLLCSLYVV